MKIQVADSIIIKDNRLLLVQQRKLCAYGLWSMPGGHVEKGETIFDAVLREVQEEIGAELLNYKHFKTYPLKFKGCEYEINTFWGEIKSDIILDKNELLNYGWFNLDELKDMQYSLRSGLVMRQANDAFSSLANGFFNSNILKNL